MADQDKKISELTETTNPASTDVLPISTDSATYKVTADNLISKTTLTGLQTTATTVAGAINELKQGQGSATLSGLTDVDISSPSAEEVLKYNSTTQKWENGVGGRTYTAGANVQISNENVISATDTTYSAGTNIQISEQNAISATIPTASANDLGGVKVGTGLEIDNNGVLSASGGGAQTALTQAEYDALVQAGTVDPTVEYFITDGIPSSVEYYHNYSTTEHIVGKWIDGKTLYEKSVYIVVPYYNSEYLSEALGNINVVSLQGYVKKYTGEVLSLGYFYSERDRVQAYFSPVDYKIHVAPAQNWESQTHEGYITIRYTKTS